MSVVEMTGPRRRAYLKTVLHRLGYDDRLLESDFPVWTGHTVDWVAFGRPEPHDMRTATVTALVVEHQHELAISAELAHSLASPALLTAFPDRLRLDSVGGDAALRPLLEEEYENFEEALAPLGRDLFPESLLAAKYANRQLSFFPLDVGLLGSARSASSASLAQRVNGAMGEAQAALAPTLPPKALMSETSRLVVGAVAALMVRDRLRTAEDTPQAIIEVAQAEFTGYFKWIDGLSDAAQSALHEAITSLGHDINYRGLDPGVVSDVYEHAVVDIATRKRLGIFYTPPELARRLVAEIPFEEIRPDDRVVVDMACGSGTLLLAAQERLLGAAPSGLDPVDAHKYATSHLLGFDADPFAVEIARLALLLHALPAGNSWRIERRSVAQGFPNDAPLPSIAVSNPPWQMLWGQSGRLQVADKFVNAMIRTLRPRGFLAVVLPGSWFEGKASRASRRLVADEAQAYEIWRLPEDTFRHSRHAVCVLFAQKGGAPRPCLFRRSLPRPTWQERFEAGIVDQQIIIDSSEPMAELPHHGPHSRERHLAELPTLDSLAHVQTGPVPTPEFDPAVRRTGSFLWLPRPGRIPFMGEVAEDLLEQTCYPLGFNWRTDAGGLYLRPKVLISGVRAPNNPWRMRVSIDTRGLIPRQSLHMVVPSEGSEASIYALAAVLGSSFAAVWVDTHNLSRSVRLAVVRSMPVPSRADAWASLDRIGRACADVAAEAGAVSKALVNELEEVVAEAYDLSPETRRSLRKHLGGFQAPEGRIRIETSEAADVQPSGTQPSTAMHRRFGSVLDVEEGRLRIWIPGLTPRLGALIEPPTHFLGRTAQAGSTFEVVAREGEDPNQWSFEFQPHSYEHDDELLKAVLDSE